MNELSCLHGSEGYGACDDEAHQRGRNAGSNPLGRNDIGKSGKKPRLFSNHVRTAKNPLFFVPLSISISDAPDSEHSTPFRVRFHRTTKRQAEQQKR